MQDSSAALVSVPAKQGQAALLAMTQAVQVQPQHVASGLVVADHAALGTGCCTWDRAAALLNPTTTISIQKRHAYTRNLHSETSGDSKTAFLHCGDVSDHVALGIELRIMWFPMLTQNQCRLDVSTYDERPGHGMGLVPCILSLCF